MGNAGTMKKVWVRDHGDEDDSKVMELRLLADKKLRYIRSMCSYDFSESCNSWE